MKKIRKALALAIALLMLLPMLGAAWAEESETPIVVLDFEDGTKAAMEQMEGYYEFGDVSVVSGGANGSAYCLRISGCDIGNGATVTGLKPDTWYNLTFTARADSISGEAYPNVGVNQYDGNAYQAVDRYTGQWTDYSILFRTGKSSTSAQIYTWIFKNGAVASADLYIDDLRLTEKKQAENLSEFDNTNLLGAGWDFETGDLTLLGDPTGTVDDGDKYYASTGALQIVEESGSGTGSKCLLITGGEVGNGVRQGGLKPNTWYKLTFYARTEPLSGAATPIIGVKEYALFGEEIVEPILTSQWQKYTCVFQTGKNDENTSVYFFTWIVNESDNASAKLYVDDIYLEETDESANGATQETEAQDNSSTEPDENAVVLQSYTKNPTAKFAIPLIIICAVELLIAATLGILLIKTKKKEKKPTETDGEEDGTE